LPEGEYRISWAGLPSSYQLKSIMAGSTDLLANPLKVEAGAPIIPITVTLEAPATWVKVGGRVPGLSSPYRLSLSGGPLADALETPLNADGLFEFPRVLPGTYTARLSPTLPVPFSVQLVVPTNQDLTGVEIPMPPLKLVPIRVLIVEGEGQVSSSLFFNLPDSSGSAPALSSAAVAQPDGTFRVLLPLGERRVSLDVPAYTVRAFRYGATDALKGPVKLSSSDSSEFLVVLAPAVGAQTVVGGDPGSGIAAPPRTRLSEVEAQGNLLSRPPQTYPELARAARVQGAVFIDVVIGKDGKVAQARLVSGHPLLAQAALDNVKQWTYKPFIVNGEAIDVVTTVTVNFRFDAAPAPPR
jgi:TonB family protein